ncbi:MAG: hydrogenase maturation protease [Phycisphaerae bacterium]
MAVDTTGNPPRVVIIGCGNPLRGDDGVGPVVIERLRARGVPPHVCLRDAGTGGVEVLDEIEGADRAIFVDACRSGAVPGTILERRAADLPSATGGGLNPHAFRWDHALALARELNDPTCPGEMTAYLIEGANFAPGTGLSPAVDAAANELVARLLTLLSTPSR